MTKCTALLYVLLLVCFPAWSAEFEQARIYIEYNSTDNDLGFHIVLDGEDWKELEIINPRGRQIFEVETGGAFRELGLTELFFEGAEPSLDEVPLEELLAMFPEGPYKFVGQTVDGKRLVSRARLSHAVPAGPLVSSRVDGDTVTISWEAFSHPPEGFPDAEIEIVAFQVLVGSFEVTLPAASRSVTLPPEFVRSLEAGVHNYEVLTIEARGNQTITSGSFNIAR